LPFVINTTGGLELLNDVTQKFLQGVLATGRLSEAGGGSLEEA
jgi:hypothetical protein